MAGNHNNILVFDLETGGFKEGIHGVCEVALILVDFLTLKEIDRYEAIIQPYSDREGKEMEYTSGAFNANGLSMRKIQNGKPAKEVAEDIREFANRGKNKTMKPVLCGHNIDEFDIPHLSHFLDCFKIKIEDLFTSKETIDTLKWAKWKWKHDPTMPKFNLGACCKKLGIRLVDAHSAMPDTEANMQLIVSMLQSLRGESQVEESLFEQKESSRVNFNF